MSATENGQTILVTGGAGFVGSHACKALAAAGYRPVVYDNLSRGHRAAVKWGPLIEGDILDRAHLEQVMRDVKPAAVVHFAAFAYVGESMANPSMYFENNVVGTARLLEAMRATGVRTLVFSSSCAVYGGVHDAPIDETTPCEPTSFYGQTKLNCEQLIRGFVRNHGFSAIALRYFNAAGADPDGEIGENHDPEPHIIPVVLRVAAGLDEKVTLNGSDHPTPDGTCVRDFVHVRDLAQAHTRAVARALLAESTFEAFNLGVGKGFSLNQIVETARRVTGRPIPVVYADRRAGDPPYAVGRAGLAHASLGWTPMFTDLEIAVADTWRWMQRETDKA
ncbi:UDP-glucose 4-epimerase GalE [Nevskia sp.]|uniref:UDP-glucose 4-epimerase GalE n=1 Tax=Nevskia sp. TaxID=1929292 RepID=UPI0025F5580C|nr:UDP-glucose 4-epimerase GalE [Nevskia sp.]